MRLRLALALWLGLASAVSAAGLTPLDAPGLPKNYIRNNSMQGAVAGTPGTLPRNWIEVSVPTGLTRTVSLATTNGIDTVTVAYSGTATSASAISLAFEAANQIAASSGQAWVSSAFAAVNASTGVTSVVIDVQGTNGASQTEGFTAPNFVSTSALARQTVTGNLANAGTTNVRQRAFTNSISNTTVVSYSITIGCPQLQHGAVATPCLRTPAPRQSGFGVLQ